MGIRYLPANDLYWLRSLQDDALPSTCVIYSVTEATGASGEQTRTTALVGTVNCRLAAQTAMERQSVEQIAMPDTFILSITHDQTLNPTDLVVYSSGTYEVQSVERSKSWQTVKRAIVRKLV